MKVSTVIPALFAATAFAHGGHGPSQNTTDITVTVTTTTSKIVETCTGPTKITQGTKTYTVTEATTLTITDCHPCTHVTVTTLPGTSELPTTPAVPTPPTTISTKPTIVPTGNTPVHPSNGTVTVPTQPPTSKPTPPPSTGAAAGHVMVGAGSAVVAVLVGGAALFL